MLYLAIDQHRKQLTVNLRNEAGRRDSETQVSTEWARVRSFLDEVRKRSAPEGGFVAIVEVCGFNDWLLKLLAEYGCRETILIQPEKRSKKKTDRRDANALGELLWVNRQRLLAGKKVQGVRRVQPPTRPRGRRSATDRVCGNGWASCARGRSTGSSTCCGNTTWNRSARPRGWTRSGTRKWLATLPLGPIDRLEMDLLLAQWKLWDEQIARVELEIEKRQAAERDGGRAGDDSRLRGLRQPGVGLADRRRSSGSRGRRVWRTIGA